MHHMPGKGFTFRHTLAVAQRNRARRLQQQQLQQHQQQPQPLLQDQVPEQDPEPAAAEEELIQVIAEDLNDILDTPEYIFLHAIIGRNGFEDELNLPRDNISLSAIRILSAE